MDVHIELAAETLFDIGPIPVTNSMLTMFIVMAFLLAVGVYAARRVAVVPGRLQAAFEIVLESLLGMTESAGGKSLGRSIFPLVSGLFVFILFANYSGLLPGVGTIGIEEEHPHGDEHTPTEEVETIGGDEESSIYTIAGVGADTSLGLIRSPQEESVQPAGEETVLVPFLRPPTADFNMTLAMALVTFTAVQIYGIRIHGVVGRIKHMADPPFLFPIEVISELSRIISLSARLFGNVFAGEALLAVMYTIGAKIGFVVIPVLVPVIFLFLELLFGTIQALVFAILTLIYISVAAAHGPNEEHAEKHQASTATSGAGD